MFQDKASKARLANSTSTHRSGQKGLQDLVCTFVSLFCEIIFVRLKEIK